MTTQNFPSSSSFQISVGYLGAQSSQREDAAAPAPSKQQFKCEYSGCSSKFGSQRGLKRHMVTHNRNAPRRGCPYPGSRCRISCDAVNQRHNWNEHIICHQGYRYRCMEPNCDRSWSSQKSTYVHKERTGHRCLFSELSPDELERELRIKDELYRKARAELIALDAWDNSWSESYSQSRKATRSKSARAAGKSRSAATSLPNPVTTPDPAFHDAAPPSLPVPVALEPPQTPQPEHHYYSVPPSLAPSLPETMHGHTAQYDLGPQENFWYYYPVAPLGEATPFFTDYPSGSNTGQLGSIPPFDSLPYYM